jgi:hypothetical protein
MKIRDFQSFAFNSYKLRLLVFAEAELVFGTVIYAAMVRGWIPLIALAALFPSWITLSAAAWEFFVHVPLLELRFDPENVDLYKPEFYVGELRKKWSFLRIEVVNNGGRAAVDCEAKIRFPKAGRPVSEEGRECESPSKEFETRIGIAWAGSSPRFMTIPPEGNAVANVMAMPEVAVHEGGIARSISDSWGKFVSWVTTLDVAKDIEAGLFSRSQDGLCEATYGIELAVFPRNGFPIIKRYKMRVSMNWENVRLERWADP